MKLRPIDEQAVALVEASSGIGCRATVDFADRGAKVVVAARGGRALDSLVGEIRDRGGDAPTGRRQPYLVGPFRVSGRTTRR